MNETWYCTFGHGQPHFGKYVIFHGSVGDAHEFMNRHYGRWSMIYSNAKDAGVETWGLALLAEHNATYAETADQA